MIGRSFGRVSSSLARRLVVAMVTLAIALFFVQPANAGPLRGGRVVLSLPDGSLGPLRLAPAQPTAGAAGGPAAGTWIGTLTITNEGDEPLAVSRVVIRGEEDDTRSPSRLTVRFVDGVSSAVLAPGTYRDLVVSWTPDKEGRVRQAFGHVVVTSTDETAGEVAMGFHAQLPTGLGWIGEHALSLLVLWPLVVPLLVGAMRVVGVRDARFVLRASTAVAAVELLLALWAYARFVPDVGRADGNDGFQLIERTVWVRAAGAEWYLGVDGTSLPLVVLVAGLGLVAVVVAGAERRGPAHYAALALLVSSVVGVFVALDLVLLYSAWQAVLLALLLLVGGWGARHGQRAAAKLAIHGALGSTAMLVAFVAMSHASDRTFLVDGGAIAHTMAIPELARTSFAAKAPVAGAPFVAVVWSLIFVAAASAAPLVPLHGWLADVLEEGPASAGVLLAGAVVALGPYLLVRVGIGAVPEGARWGGAAMAVLGVLTAGWGALCAMAQRDLRRFVAYATLANAGGCVYGLGSLTLQGIAGAVTSFFTHGLAAALLLGAAAAIKLRARTCDATRLGGLGTEAPLLTALVCVGLGVSLGAPGLAGAWGIFLVLLGGFARHALLTALLAVALVGGAAAHVRVARMILLGRAQLAARRADDVAALDHHFGDASPTELAALVPLAALGVLLGLWPAPVVSPVSAAARDASAVVDPAVPGTIDPR